MDSGLGRKSDAVLPKSGSGVNSLRGAVKGWVEGWFESLGDPQRLLCRGEDAVKKRLIGGLKTWAPVCGCAAGVRARCELCEGCVEGSGASLKLRCRG